MVGKKLGHYQITEKLGAGGMGEVYLARDERLERDVAIKVLPPDSFKDEEARKRFRKEALTLSKLNHPHIATVHDFNTEEGTDYLVMEYVAGENLADKIESGPLLEAEVARLGAQIAGALEEAHEAGVIHRDLKPRNISFTTKGNVKVLDFGIAKLVHKNEDTATVDALTKTVGLTGTLSYMAPEQLQGKSADERSDIHALGVVLYEMATGKRPFPFTTPATLMRQILEEMPEQPSKVQPGVSPGLEAVIQKCLEKDPGRRFQTAKELHAALSGPATAGEVLATWHYGQVASKRRVPGASIGIALGILVVLAMVAVGLNLGGLRDRLFGGPAGGEITSIAVLPLNNLMGDAGQDYFVEGMHEALITQLSKIGALTVISHTTMSQYRNTEKSIPEIARELGVQAVVRGAVLSDGNMVRISAQLIEAASDRNLWADDFDREKTNILSLYSDVARSVAREIQVTLTPEEETLLIDARTVNPEAYQRYLQGQFLVHQGSREAIEEGIKYFEEGIAIDPNDALSYAGLANAYRSLSSLYLPPLEVMPKAKAAALKALELDPTFAEARTTLAYIKLNFDWDIPGAEAELKRALEINPNSADAHSFYGAVLASLGRHEEATAEMNRALKIDPLSLWAHTYSLIGYYMARDYDKAIESCEVVLRQVPTFPWAHAFKGLSYAQKGQFPEAIAAAEAATQSADSLFMQAIRAQVYAITGKTREAKELLVEIKERARRQYVCPYEISLAYVALGDKDEAFDWLERAYLARADCMIWLRVDVRLDPIRDDPRFQDLLSRIKFPD